MKEARQFFESLKRGDTDVIQIDLQANAERYCRICNEMLDELIKRTEGPVEAFMVLHYLIESLGKSNGIEGGLILEAKDLGNT
jgi:hypothetical protein